MTKSLPRFFSDDFLRSNGVLDLDPETLLQPSEAAVLLGTTVKSLERVRKAGDPPPFRQMKPRGSVRYMLGDVLAARKLHRHTSIAAVAKAHDDHFGSQTTFNDFLSVATVEDEWPCVSVSIRDVDRPVDLFSALRLLIENRGHLRWLTRADFVAKLQGALETEPRARLAKERQGVGLVYGEGLPPKDKVRSRT
jgi:hypothetical protein